MSERMGLSSYLIWSGFLREHSYPFIGNDAVRINAEGVG
jgi:hypothetical protein